MEKHSLKVKKKKEKKRFCICHFSAAIYKVLLNSFEPLQRNRLTFHRKLMVFEGQALFHLPQLLMCCLRPVELHPWCPHSNMEEPLNRSLKPVGEQGSRMCLDRRGANANISLPEKHNSYKNEFFEYKHPSWSGADARQPSLMNALASSVD